MVGAGADREGQTPKDAPGDEDEMYHLLRTLPVCGTLGVMALLTGPLARFSIDLGAWLLDHLDRRLRG